MPLLTRRRILTGLIAAPIVVATPGLLMKVKELALPVSEFVGDAILSANLVGMGIGNGFTYDFLLSDGRVVRVEGDEQMFILPPTVPISDVTAEYKAFWRAMEDMRARMST